MGTSRNEGTSLSRRSFIAGAATVAGVAMAMPRLGALADQATPTAIPANVKRGGTLNIGADVSPVGLDPALTTAFASVAIYEQMYSSLLTLDYTTNQIIPDLAESWSTVDEKTVEFKLRQGVKFHSGRELTAADVKYTIDRLMNPSVAVPLRAYLGPGAAAEVVDTYTVRISNSTPYAPLVSVLADRRPCAIVDHEVIDKNGDLSNSDGGSGPFKLTEYTPDVRVVLARNENYYDSALPFLDGIQFQIIPDENARVSAIRAGEVDLTVVKDPKLAKTLQGDSNVVLNSIPSFWRSGTAFNTQHKPLDDIRVRQAISYAINRQELIDTVLLGDGSITGVIPPGEKVWAVPATPDNFPDYAFDTDKAAQLLKDAGASNLKFTIDASPAYATDPPTAQVMQAQLKKIGIDLEIRQLEFATLLANQKSGDFDLSLSFNTNRPDPDTYLGAAYTGASSNVGHFSDPALDKLLDQGRATFDIPTRQGIYAQAQKLYASDNPILFTYVIKNYEPAMPYVKGYVQMASGYRLSLKQTWLDK